MSSWDVNRDLSQCSRENVGLEQHVPGLRVPEQSRTIISLVRIPAALEVYAGSRAACGERTQWIQKRDGGRLLP